MKYIIINGGGNCRNECFGTSADVSKLVDWDLMFIYKTS